jgi:hypothetical protein
MTKEHVRDIIERVLTWPQERQAEIVRLVELIEAQENSTVRLSDEDAAEVRRRMAEKSPKTVTLAEFNERLNRRYGA